ncbi:uncharacterized protein B0H18DRAFT_1084017 [Fomitopsis serialis]|uniref:uncharacterized protein n=1 Tax=Fomitopsis serialis TaxID=139415 RepID=UPI00200857CC|nr:uncharacterized protein B0H18DRAFT_1084017 [Neoantrodia serialis]KAH9930140.1 hypothetical protein B0H18DRAFT_1084017 [Neoantrodia serialis]
MPGSLFPRSESLIPDSPPTPEVQERRKVEQTRPPTEKSEKAKGKERAWDTSGEVQVRGKERELRAAREAQARDEPGRDDEERECDKLRIRMLEEEITRLRAQLAARNDGSSHLQPPPAPPPPPTAKLFKAPITPTGARANSFLASARAHLKPTTPPIEAPINAAAGRTRRAGQPTVNVPSDKMAAFLKEMKTVRLRKVSTGESDSRAMPPPRYVPGERSFSAVENNIGEKRKRDALFVGDMDPGPSKKRNTTFIVPSTSAGSSASSQSSQSSQTSANSSLFFPHPDHVPPRGWPSVATTETDITTPSLCSDNENENENEQDADDRLPPTPPHNRIRHSAPGRVDQRKPSSSRDVIDVDAEFPEPNPVFQPQPRPARQEKTPPYVDFLARRPPNSPMPPTPVRRVPAPARKRAKPQPAPMVDEDVSDDLGRPGSTPHPTREKRPARKSGSRTSSSASRETSAHSSAKSQEAPSNRARRRRTLDDELRRAGDRLWDPDALSDDELAGGVESSELVGVGMKSKKKGFLKGGGAAGKPVFVGVGHVQGVEDDGDDEDEDDPPPPVPRRRKGAKARERVE